MSKWKTYRLGEICDLVAGFAFKSNHFGNYANQVIKIADIQPPIVKKELMGVDLSTYDANKLKKYIVSRGDFVLAMTGATIGKIGRITTDTKAYINQRVLTFRPNPLNIDKSYLYYLLSVEKFNKYILNHIDSETAQPNISANSIGGYEITLPPLAEQKRIADILSAIDDKIELNRRINANLEQQAQALYKSWFVDFEPFGGKMPEDWREGTLGEICTELKEKVHERDDVKVLSPVATGQLMLSEEFFTKQVYSKSIAKYIVVPQNCFAYNPARVNIGSLGMNEFDFDGCVSPVYVVFRCQNGYEYFFDLFRRTKPFKDEVKLRAIGGVRQTLGYDDFARIQVNIPTYNVVQDFNKIYLTNLDVRWHNQYEILRLAHLRDTLLPKLMSGEITV